MDIIGTAAEGCTDENTTMTLFVVPLLHGEAWGVLACAAKAISATNLPASKLCAIARGALGGYFCPVQLPDMYFR